MATRQTFPFPRTSANKEFPYDPFAKQGDPGDSVTFIQPPGVAFYRPWISIPGGLSFIWPIGLEGFNLEIDPVLGIHKYVGGNAVQLNVVHKGEEHFTLDGNFPGKSSTDAMQRLRDIVYANQPVGGKILYLPGVLPYAQRVGIVHMSSGRTQDDRGTDLTYSIEFIRIGIEKKYPDPQLAATPGQPLKGAKGGSSRIFKTTGTVRTLRAIAQLKLKDANKWQSIYSKNLAFFNRGQVTSHQAPTWRIPIGTTIYW